jgi:hypothetical protein
MAQARNVAVEIRAREGEDDRRARLLLLEPLDGTRALARVQRDHQVAGLAVVLLDHL